MSLIKIFFALGLAVSLNAFSNSDKLQELKNTYLNHKIPYSRYSEIGYPKTLNGTNNSQWVAYFPKGDFTIISDKKTDIIKKIYEGRVEQ